MKISNRRTFIIDENEYFFNNPKFKIYYKKIHKLCCKREENGKITELQFREKMADSLHVSAETVKNWIYGYNGPGDIAMVQSIADYLDIDYMELLEKKEINIMNNTMQITNITNDEKAETLKRLFDLFCEVITDYQNKFGYNEEYCNDWCNEMASTLTYYKKGYIEKAYYYDDVLVEIRKASYWLGREMCMEFQSLLDRIYGINDKRERYLPESIKKDYREYYYANSFETATSWNDDEDYLEFLNNNHLLDCPYDVFGDFIDFKADCFMEELYAIVSAAR